MMGVLRNLGHRTTFIRGERIYESPGFFHKLMVVEQGVVAKALIDPYHEDPLLLSLSGAGALCGSYETLYLQDRMQRRHWCMTTAQVLMVNADLLLRICDQNPVWQRELAHYSSVCAVSDRLGLLVTHSSTIEERFGVFLVACSISGSTDFSRGLRDPSVEWIPINALPSMSVAASMLNTAPAQLREIVSRWSAEDALRYRSHKILLSRGRFCAYWERIKPILHSADAYERSALSTDLPVRDMPIP